jgi:predicted Zn-dependent protease
VAFSGWVNGLLAVTLVWYELASSSVKWAGWVAAFGTWFVLAVRAWRNLPKRQGQNATQVQNDTRQDGNAEDAYPAAVNHYLKRNYVEAERLLANLIVANPRDVPAGLLRATIWRKSERPEDSRRELERLMRLEAATQWQLEIEREINYLENAVKDGSTQSAESKAA